MKKRILTATLTLIMALSALASVAIAEGNNFETWYVVCDELNLRIEPNTNIDPITSYDLGTELTVIGVDNTGNWWEVYDGVNQGYVFKQYLTTNKGKYAHGRPIGTFKITGYTPNLSENAGYSTTCTGASLSANAGKIVATDHSIIPLYKHIYIEGLGTYQVLDSGVSDRVIDVLTNSDAESDAITGNRMVYLLD